jgi:hypothetical protein
MRAMLKLSGAIVAAGLISSPIAASAQDSTLSLPNVTVTEPRYRLSRPICTIRGSLMSETRMPAAIASRRISSPKCGAM